jgi:phosphoribosylaminoimidazole-succinocarboxamide synthase
VTHTPRAAQGKVRDTYDCGDCIVIVTTDRQSAFDRLLAAVPFKGRVLNGTSAWWMGQTAHVARNALLAVPHPNVAVMRKCTVFPVEFVGARQRRSGGPEQARTWPAALR